MKDNRRKGGGGREGGRRRGKEEEEEEEIPERRVAWEVEGDIPLAPVLDHRDVHRGTARHLPHY